MSNRAPGLDLARFLAALAVVAFHWLYFVDQTWKPAAYFHVALPYFFMMSGYLVTKTAEGRSRGEFFWARFLRIVPGFTICASLTALAMIAFGVPVALSTYLANLTYAPQLFGEPYLDGVYWTMTVEVVFYLSVGLCCMSGDYHNRLRLLAIAWPTLAVAGEFVPALDFVPYIGFSVYVSLGVILFLWERERRPLDLRLLVGLIALSAVAGFDQGERIPDASPFLSATLVLAIAAAMPVLTKIRLPRSRAWTMLSDFTFPLYLLHFGLVLPLREVMPLGAALLLMAAICVGVAWIERVIRSKADALKAALEPSPQNRYLQPRRIGGSPHLVHVDSDLGIVGQERV